MTSAKVHPRSVDVVAFPLKHQKQQSPKSRSACITRTISQMARLVRSHSQHCWRVPSSLRVWSLRQSVPHQCHSWVFNPGTLSAQFCAGSSVCFVYRVRVRTGALSSLDFSSRGTSYFSIIRKACAHFPSFYRLFNVTPKCILQNDPPILQKFRI